MFSPKGQADPASGTVPVPFPWRVRRYSYLNFIRSGISTFSWPRGREQQLPEMNFRPRQSG